MLQALSRIPETNTAGLENEGIKKSEKTKGQLYDRLPFTS
jgi:hypothetical protein